MPTKNKTFRLFTEYESVKYYLGALRKVETDLREDPGPTTFVSAGTTQEYQQTTWRLDNQGRICIASAPESCKLPKEELMLAAHRTFMIDIRGNCETYVIITTFRAHEAYWKLSRVGSLEDNRCNIQITNNRCVKDKIDHCGWSLDLPVSGVAARGTTTSNWKEINQRPARNETSVYSLLTKKT